MKTVFDEVHFYNRWKWYPGARKLRIDGSSPTVYIGITKRYFAPYEFSYAFHFFGFEMYIWFKQIPR